MILVSILVFIISCLILAFAGTKIVRSLIKIAKFLRWREFIVTSVLMAFVTSLPELFVGISSAFHGEPELSFGNVIGSNIAALTLIMGMGALLAKDLRFRGSVLQKSSLYTALIAPLPLLLLLDGKVSRWDGLVLLGVLGLYFFYLLSQEKRFTEIFSDKLKGGLKGLKSFLKNLALFFASALLLLLSAEGVVFSAVNIADELGLSLVITGAILVALGTSMPEITFSIRSISMGHKQMILGDLMGAVVVNSSLVLGLTALICPFEIANFLPYFVGFAFTIIIAFLFAIFAQTDQKITQKEAIFLLFLYIIFIVTEILIK